jgi:hypothetical protein
MNQSVEELDLYSSLKLGYSESFLRFANLTNEEQGTFKKRLALQRREAIITSIVTFVVMQVVLYFLINTIQPSQPTSLSDVLAPHMVGGAAFGFYAGWMYMRIERAWYVWKLILEHFT